MIECNEGSVHLSATGATVCAEVGCVVAAAIEFIAKDCGDKFANERVDEAIKGGKKAAKKYGEPTHEQLLSNALEQLDDLEDSDIAKALKSLLKAMSAEGKEKNDG